MGAQGQPRLERGPSPIHGAPRPGRPGSAPRGPGRVSWTYRRCGVRCRTSGYPSGHHSLPVNGHPGGESPSTRPLPSTSSTRTGSLQCHGRVQSRGGLESPKKSGPDYFAGCHRSGQSRQIRRPLSGPSGVPPGHVGTSHAGPNPRNVRLPHTPERPRETVASTSRVPRLQVTGPFMRIVDSSVDYTRKEVSYPPLSTARLWTTRTPPPHLYLSHLPPVPSLATGPRRGLIHTRHRYLWRTPGQPRRPGPQGWIRWTLQGPNRAAYIKQVGPFGPRPPLPQFPNPGPAPCSYPS